VLDGFAGPARSALEATLDVPAEWPVGGEVPIRIEIQRHRGTRPLRVRVRVDHGERLTRIPETSLDVGPDGATWSSLRRARLRGPCRIERIWLGWEGPLGLIQRHTERALETKLVIVPDLGPVRGVAMQAAMPRQYMAGLKVERYVGDGSEFQALREYVPGYDPRSIDYSASARHRALLCREFRAERNHPVVVAIDTGRLMRESVEGTPKLDGAITAGLVLAWLGLFTGDRVGLYGFDAKVRGWFPPRGGLATFSHLVREAGHLDYQTVETNFTLGLTHLGQRLDRRSLIVLLTDFVDTTTAQLMVENVARLAKRHLVVFVALKDPALPALADREPRSSTQLYESVVGEQLLQERRRVLRRLQRIGVLCLDAAPRDISTRLVNQYLELKRMERIG